MDLGALSLKELKSLQGQLAKAIATFEERHRATTLAELQEHARAKGFSLSDLIGAPKTHKRTQSAAKYANPANPSDTWTGRGRKPRWFTEALIAGKNPEELLL